MGGAFDEVARASLAPFLAFVTAFLRAAYRGKRWKARLLEGSLLAMATIGVAPVLRFFGLPPDLAVAFAVAGGYIGVDTLSDWLRRWGESRVGNGKK